jgi:hypothetical protein
MMLSLLLVVFYMVAGVVLMVADVWLTVPQRARRRLVSANSVRPRTRRWLASANSVASSSAHCGWHLFANSLSVVFFITANFITLFSSCLRSLLTLCKDFRIDESIGIVIRCARQIDACQNCQNLTRTLLLDPRRLLDPALVVNSAAQDDVRCVRSSCAGILLHTPPSPRSRRRARRRCERLRFAAAARCHNRRTSRRFGRQHKRRRGHTYRGRIHRPARRRAARRAVFRACSARTSFPDSTFQASSDLDAISAPGLSPGGTAASIGVATASRVCAFLDGDFGVQPRYSCIIDSGATHSMTGDRSIFEGWVKTTSVSIAGIGDGTTATAIGRGSVDVGGRTLLLSNLLFVPNMQYTLISVRSLCKEGMAVTFTDDDFTLSSS